MSSIINGIVSDVASSACSDSNSYVQFDKVIILDVILGGLNLRFDLTSSIVSVFTGQSISNYGS